jgi:hypothetical protein
VVEELGEDGGGAVERVARWDRPPRGLEHPPGPPLLARRDRVDGATAVDHGVELLPRPGPGQVDDVVPDQREELELVAVAVDDRVAEAVTDAAHRVVAYEGERHALSLSRPSVDRRGQAGPVVRRR